MKKVKVLFELICFVLGPAITAYSIFDFRVGPSRRFGDDAYPYYYYTDESQVAIAVSVALICLGIVLRSWWSGKK